jgi:protein-S-isoprenylcysteine O-methyltransferase Ste14
MNKPDDLERLWQTQSVGTDVKGEEMRQAVLKKTKAFDRKIWRQHLWEYLASLFVVPLLLRVAWIMPNRVARVGGIIVVAGALWIMYYFWRRGSGPVDPLPDQTLSSYRRALIEKYDYQIRLLRKVKIWYMLPFYVGLTILMTGLLQYYTGQSALAPFHVILAVVTTGFFGAIWWLDDVSAARRLERFRDEVGSKTDAGETPHVI